MNTAVKSELKPTTFCNRKSYTFPRQKEIGFVNNKFYQKLFVVLISFSTFLIFPESPKELENICTNYNSRKLCNVW